MPRYSNPDRRLIEMATEFGIRVLEVSDVNSPEFLGAAEAFKCDLFVSMSFDQIFKKDIINLPPLKTINCHAGKLPFYRGRNILNWALINDEKQFGITVHFVDEGIDTGDILMQKTFAIGDNDNYHSLLEKSEVECATLLYETVKAICSGVLKPMPQSEIHPHGFYCVKRIEGDEVVEWENTSREVFNFIRALCPPGPSARSFINKKEIKLHHALYIPDAPVYRGIPGSVVQKNSNSFCVKTQDSYVKIVLWDYEGHIRVGDRLKPHG